MSMSGRLARLTLLAICILALAAGPAMAQSTPTEDAYGGQAGVQQGGGGGTPTVSGGTGSLPFTGLQIGIAALAGAGLAGAGFALRRGLQAPAQP
jgi:hypothetical protein